MNSPKPGKHSEALSASRAQQQGQASYELEYLQAGNLMDEIDSLLPEQLRDPNPQPRTLAPRSISPLLRGVVIKHKS